MSTRASTVSGTGLRALVDAEARLDDMLANAKHAAEELRDAARRNAAAADAAFARDLERERARANAELEARAAAERTATETEALAQVARFDGVRGERMLELARVLADKVAAIAREGSS